MLAGTGIVVDHVTRCWMGAATGTSGSDGATSVAAYIAGAEPLGAGGGATTPPPMPRSMAWTVWTACAGWRTVGKRAVRSRVRQRSMIAASACETSGRYVRTGTTLPWRTRANT